MENIRFSPKTASKSNDQKKCFTWFVTRHDSLAGNIRNGGFSPLNSLELTYINMFYDILKLVYEKYSVKRSNFLVFSRLQVEIKKMKKSYIKVYKRVTTHPYLAPLTLPCTHLSSQHPLFLAILNNLQIPMTWLKEWSEKHERFAEFLKNVPTRKIIFTKLLRLQL